MRSNEEQGAPAPSGESTPKDKPLEQPEESGSGDAITGAPDSSPHPDSVAPAGQYGYDEHGNYTYNYDDPYGYNQEYSPAAPPEPVTPAVTQPAAPPPPPRPPADSDSGSDGGDGDDGMLRMSFLEHLEELRSRIIRMLAGLAVAYCVSLWFAERLYVIVAAPATAALTELGVKPPTLTQLRPMEAFTVVWIKLPLLTAVFLGSPWVLYQVWAFVAPGLYKKERRWAAPFVICSAGLFILGGVFAYFIAFRFGLTFLLGVGRDIGITPLVSVSEYFDLFVNVMLGIGIVFEMPVVIFFLTLLRIASPRFLLANSRYAILAIVIIAAIVTPTPDVFNLMLFSVPMVLLFFLGLFASYLLVLQRERKRFPWGVFLSAVGIPIAIVAGGLAVAVTRYGFHLVPHWPFLVR